jgi:hypothetical protein
MGCESDDTSKVRRLGGALAGRHARETLQVARALFVFGLIFVLSVLTVIDIDGDPTTTNLPSVVLIDSGSDEDQGYAIVRRVRSRATDKSLYFPRVHHRVRQSGQSGWRFLPIWKVLIRGP